MPQKRKLIAPCSRCKKRERKAGDRWCIICRSDAVARSKRKRIDAWRLIADIAHIIEPGRRHNALEVAELIGYTVARSTAIDDDARRLIEERMDNAW